MNKIILAMALVLFATTGLHANEYPHPSTYIPSPDELEKAKSVFNDPRATNETLPLMKILPKEILDALVYDVDEMKAKWAQAVGFVSVDRVGKLHPEIKPGTYTWQEVHQSEAFKDLIPEGMLEKIREPGPPMIGAYDEIKVIPTRQYYWCLPIAEATLQNDGKAKLDDDGYIILDTIPSGYMFPKPSGPFRGKQIIYNFKYNYGDFGEDCEMPGDTAFGFNSSLNMDNQTTGDYSSLRLQGRVLFEPYGWYNDTAKKLGKAYTTMFQYAKPRDVDGMINLTTFYMDPERLDENSVYIPAIRRVRKLSSSDTQDPFPGESSTYDDIKGFSQAISKTNFQFKANVIAEREYLIPAYTLDGSTYLDSKNGYAVKNAYWERRPLYVVEIEELDTNYVYSKKNLYIDQETFMILYMESFDQKGRKYRTLHQYYHFWEEAGLIQGHGGCRFPADHIDTHSEVGMAKMFPAVWSDSDISFKKVLRGAK